MRRSRRGEVQFIKGGRDSIAYNTAKLLGVDIVSRDKETFGLGVRQHTVVLYFEDDVNVLVYDSDEYWEARYMFEIILEALNTGKNVWVGDLMSRHAYKLSKIKRRKEKQRQKK